MDAWIMPLDLVMAKEARKNGGAARTGVKPRAFGSPCWCSLCIYGMCVCRHDMYRRYVYTYVSEQVMGFCRAIRRSIGISCNWTYRPRRPSSTVELMNAFKAEKSSYNWFLCYL